MERRQLLGDALAIDHQRLLARDFAHQKTGDHALLRNRQRRLDQLRRRLLPGEGRPGASGDDEALLLGCDGLWDTVSEQEAARLVAETVKQPAMIASRLVEAALAAGSDDNVTALVVLLRGQETAERIF